MKLLLFTLLAVSAQLSPRIEDYKDRFKDALYRSAPDDKDRSGDTVDSSRLDRDPLIGDPPASSSLRRRFIRNTGDHTLKSLLARLQSIARLTNGIYLHRGLTTGSIPPADLIPELLHFGSVKMSQITGVNLNGVQDAVKILRDLPTQLVAPGSDVTEVEDTLAVIEQIMEALDEVEGGIKDRDLTEFKKLITDLADTKIEIAPFSDLLNSFETKWYVFKTLESTAPPPDTNRLEGYFGDLKDFLEMIKATESKLRASGPIPFKSPSDAFAPSLKISEATSLFSGSLSSFTRTLQWPAYFTFMTNFLDTINPLKSTIPDLHLVLNALVAHHSRLHSNLTYSHGLPNGAPDLARMLDELNSDGWLKTLVKTDRLVAAFSSLKNLETESKKVYQELGEQLIGDLKPLVSTIELLNRLVADKAAIVSGINSLEKLAPPSSAPPTSSWSDIWVTNVEAIDTAFGELQKKVDKLLVAVSDPELAEMCGAVIKICEKSVPADADRSALVTEFNGYEKKADFKSAVDAIYKLVGDVDTARSEIQTIADVVKGNLAMLESYYVELKEVGGYFDSLQAIPGLKSVFGALSEVGMLRKLDAIILDSYSVGSEVVKKVVDLKETFGKMEKLAGEMKGVSTPESDAMELLEDPGRHSKTIGSAVRGVAVMENAVERKSDVDSFLAGFDVVGRYKNLSQESIDLDSLVADVSKMYTSLDAFQKSVTIPNSTTLADLSGSFQNAKSVTGVHGDLQKLGALVGKLKVVVTDVGDQQKLEDVRLALGTLDSMALGFAGYHKDFDGSRDSLAALDAFFVDYLNKINEVPLVVQEEESSILKLIIIAAFTLLMAILIVHLILFICKRDTFFKIYKCCRRKTPGAIVVITGSLFELILSLLMTHIREEGDTEDEWFPLGWSNAHSKENVYVANEKLYASVQPTEYRFEIPLLEATRVVLTGYGNRSMSNLYHANIFRLPNKRELILAQGPQVESDGKNSTIAKFWWMAKQKGSKCIAMLCQLKEAEKVQCDEYFPNNAGETKTDGDLKIECLDKKTKIDGRVEIRKLRTTFGNEPAFTTTHYSFNGFSETLFPNFPEEYAKFMKMVLNEPGTTLVHCSDGIRRTGMFALSSYLIYSTTQTKQLDMKTAWVALNDSRIGCMHDWDEYAFSAVVMIEYLGDGVKIKKKEVQDEHTLLRNKWQEVHIAKARGNLYAL